MVARSMATPEIRSASSTAAVIDDTVSSTSTTTPLRIPFVGAVPTPMTLGKAAPSSCKPTIQQTFVLPISRPI
jgi:hypothetical protein